MDNQNTSPISTDTMNTSPVQSTPTPAPAPAPAQPQMPKPAKSGIGSVIATIIIIVLIILGALYFWGQRIETQRANQQAMDSVYGNNDSETAAAAAAVKVQTVSQDDSVSTLQAELQNTNTADLGADVNQ